MYRHVAIAHRNPEEGSKSESLFSSRKPQRSFAACNVFADNSSKFLDRDCMSEHSIAKFRC